MQDTSRILIGALRTIRPETSDKQVDEEADRLAGALGYQGKRSPWTRELLFRYRGVRLGDASHRAPLIALLERAGACGLLSAAAIRIVHQLVEHDPRGGGSVARRTTTSGWTSSRPQ